MVKKEKKKPCAYSFRISWVNKVQKSKCVPPHLIGDIHRFPMITEKM